ncbi:hypothetical protein [Solirubrobacter soli]|uniref:hypothetical protein n=1 Tax=Solirubrobacter soli TaxID=363832 RepID=UPI0003FFB543|nr:hypothetical protein [Solirubrobacter soli]
MGSWSKRSAALAVAGVLLAACGGGGESGAPVLPAAAPAKSFELADFQPGDAAEAGSPADVSFEIKQPSGQALTEYATGSGPHTGVHLLFVRDDLSTIIHRHPPVKPDGTIDDKVTFKEPGRYRVVVDAYPKASGSLKNFQLFRWMDVGGQAKTAPLPPFAATQKVGGYTFKMEGSPQLKAVEASLLKVTVTDRDGKPAEFTPYYGALAHAIFFKEGSLDYFHTHVCAPGATGCTSQLGGASVTGTSATPGDLEIGVLLPVPGTWRLFIQTKVGGKVLTAPFTLTVR